MTLPSEPEALYAVAIDPSIPVARRELALFDMFDALAGLGELDSVLAVLAARNDLPKVLAGLLPYAKTQAHAPLIIGHRGDPTNFVENTLPGIASAFQQGADAVELDITLVREDDGDGYEIIARHDPTPGGLTVPGFYAVVRNLGFEPWVYADDLFLARPTSPPVWRRALRKPSWELTLSCYRTNYGYAEVKSWPLMPRVLEAEIPTLGQVGALLASGYRDKIVFLDTRLPAGRPELQHAMAQRIATVVSEHGLDPGNFIIGNSDKDILSGLRAQLERPSDRVQPRVLGREFSEHRRSYRYSLDEMMLGPFARAEGTSALAKTIAFDTDLGDVGHVFWGSDAELLEVVERDAAEMFRLGKQLVVWTINDECMFRKLLGIGGRAGGGVEMVITDRPRAFRERLDRMGLGRASG